MSLLLTIIQSPENTELKENTRTFDGQGGSIGRGADNQWVLQDPERYLSSRHCQITHQGGQYLLVDTSTNGTFLNGSSEPMGKGNSAVLKDGDRFTLGDYEFQVTLWGAPQAGADSPFGSPAQSNGADDDIFGSPSAAGSPFGSPMPGHIPSSDPLFSVEPEETDPLAALDKAGASSAPANPFMESDPFANTPSSQPSSDPFGFGGSYSDGADPMQQNVSWPSSSPAGGGGGIPEDWDLDEDPLAPQPMNSPPAPQQPVPPQPVPPQAAPTPPPAPIAPAPVPQAGVSQQEADQLKARIAELDQANKILAAQVEKLQNQPAAPRPASAGGADHTLIDALGLGERALDDAQIADINQMVGELMREMVAGLMQILSSRSSIKNEFRMSVTTIQPVENNPLKFSVNVDDALENMFIKKGNAYKKPREAIQEGFGEIAQHQVAVLAGIRSAFKGVIERFDPLQMEKRFEKQNKGGLIPGSKNAKNWELFCDYYNEVAGDLDNSFQYLFGDDFVRAYEDQLQRLAIARASQKREQ